ncbi:unnamed protein product [Alternaria alternata]
MEFFQFLFYLWLLFADVAFAFANITVAGPDYPHVSQRRSSAGELSSNSLASTGTYSSCNLQVPSNISWPYFRELVANFTRVHVDQFRRDYRYTTFPLYLRENFAPDLPPSSMTCDSVGECSLTSCQLLNPELSPYDRQMAYFVFEQISGATYIDGQIPELIRTYSASPRIERQLQKKLMDRRRYEKLAMAIVGGAGLMAGGVMALPVFGIAATTGVAMTNLLTATYVSVVGSFNAVRPDPRHISSNLEENIHSSLNEFRHAMISNETFSMQSIMGHRPNTPGQDLVDVIAVVPQDNLQDAIRNRDYHTISEAAKRDRAMGKNLGKVPGGFNLPICVNPGGEAISSDWDKRARNYPCMCGNFGWNDGTWTYQADETETFLVHTGLMYSEDWERFCHRNGECKGVE